MSYAIIAVGGKQYRVREGERLLVDGLSEEEERLLVELLKRMTANVARLF